MSQRHLAFWPPKMPRHLSVPETSLWFNLEVSAARFPRKPAIVFYDRVIAFAALKDECERLAGYLQKRCGVRRGDRVALFAQNSPQFIIGYYAILRADAMVVPVNPMLLGGEIEHIVGDSGARVMIAAQELWPRVEPLVGRALSHVVVGCYSDELPASRGDLPAPPDWVTAPRQPLAAPGVETWHDAVGAGLRPGPAQATADDPCVLPYTSGTTGKPKGCVHTHRNAMHTTVAVPQWNRVYQDEVGLAVLPYFHVTGMQNSMNSPIYGGATVVILPRWDRDAALALIQRHRVTSMSAVPTMIVDLVASPRLGEHDLSSIGWLGGGGAAMPEAVAQKLHDLCGITFIEGYGLTETMAPSHINPTWRPKKQCLGIPIFDTESRVVDPTSFVELPPGEVGEIVTRGPQVFQGYWQNPEATAAAFVEIEGQRFFRTGDLARTDEDGYFFLVDRLKRMINVAGFKVWPAEVESMLYAHPAIQEAVVIARPDARRGEGVKAVVVLRQTARGQVDGEALQRWAKEHMAAYKVPCEFELVESLPKSATGKIQWRVLQEKEREKETERERR
jgi:fatty-acyl-CoA synthase